MSTSTGTGSSQSPTPGDVARPVLVMGVSGSGKSTIGAAVAERFGDGAVFIDADDLHPRANKDKMAAGIPLTDDDRWPWLDVCAARIHEVQTSGKRCVMANSALKRAYRDRLRSVDPDLFVVFLSGDRDLIAERQRHRHHEYMPTSLLDSQFATLEPLQDDEAGAVVPIDGDVDRTVDAIAEALDTAHRA